MLASDAEIDRLARDLILRHGSRAAMTAIERLNEMIDRNNRRGRETWACVVHAIHELQGTGPVRPSSAGGVAPHTAPRT